MSRIMIAPQQNNPQNSYKMLMLPHPNAGACYFMFSGSKIFQMHCIDQPFASFSFNNSIISDGSVYHFTPYDPLYLLVPHLQAHSNSHQFVSLDNMLSSDEYPHLQKLENLPDLPNILSAVCDSTLFFLSEATTIQDNEVYYRLNADKVLQWLKRKVEKMLENFDVLGFKLIDDRDSRILIILDILSDNLSSDHHKMLVESYKYLKIYKK